MNPEGLTPAPLPWYPGTAKSGFGTLLSCFECFWVEELSGTLLYTGQLLSSSHWPWYQLPFLSAQGRAPSALGDLSPSPCLDLFVLDQRQGSCRSWEVRRSEGVWGEWLGRQNGGGQRVERTNNCREPRMNEVAHPLCSRVHAPTEIAVCCFVQIVWYQIPKTNIVITTNQIFLARVRKGRLHRRGVIWAES